MTIPFRELAGSPVERYTPGGFSARREFLVPWESRGDFAEELLGVSSAYADAQRAAYPGKTTVLAQSIYFEPLDPDSLDEQALTDVADEMNNYSGAFAKALVDYRAIGERDRTDGPENESGTRLSYRMRFAAEYQSLSPRSWRWEDDETILPPEDLTLVKRIPATEHHLTWSQVVNPPWSAIQSMQGMVNQSEFLGCPAETLLFEGAEANKLYSAGIQDGASGFAWEIRYVFREKAIKQGGQTYGWNHFYRESPAGWIRLTQGTANFYDAADFAVLFQSEENA
jgi:hypothetical protein